MDGFNEKSNEEVEQQQPLGCLHRFSKTIKIVIIGGLIILLMIPMFMIEDLISERGRTQEEAINEVSEKWSLAQTVTGPYLNIQYPVVTENKGEKKVSIKDLMLFPDELSINGQLKTEILKRSIYEVNVYQSELTLKGPQKVPGNLLPEPDQKGEGGQNRPDGGQRNGDGARHPDSQPPPEEQSLPDW